MSRQARQDMLIELFFLAMVAVALFGLFDGLVMGTL